MNARYKQKHSELGRAAEVGLFFVVAAVGMAMGAAHYARERLAWWARKTA
jgi:hypothetical protein